MDVDWGEVNPSSSFGMLSTISIRHPGFLVADAFPYPFTDFAQVHRLQLPASSAHVSVIAFDTQQELLWTGDETVRSA